MIVKECLHRSIKSCSPVTCVTGSYGLIYIITGTVGSYGLVHTLRGCHRGPTTCCARAPKQLAMHHTVRTSAPFEVPFSLYKIGIFSFHTSSMTRTTAAEHTAARLAKALTSCSAQAELYGACIQKLVAEASLYIATT